MDRIRTMTKSDNQEFGIGLYNTIARLKHHFGENYEFIIESVVNEYTQVIIKIPFETEE